MCCQNHLSQFHLLIPGKPTKSQNRKSKDNCGKSKQSKQDNKQYKSSKERIIPEDDSNQMFSDDEISHLSDDGDLSGDDISDDIKKKDKPDVWEDIYGRKRDKEGNIIKVYIKYFYCTNRLLYHPLC